MPLLGIYMDKMLIEKDPCTPVFIAALFTIARRWKPPKCPSAEQWIKKSWYIYTTEHSAAAATLLPSCPTLCDPIDGSQNSELMPFAATWMDPEIITLSKPDKDMYHFYMESEINLFTKQSHRHRNTHGYQRGKWERDTSGI